MIITFMVKAQEQLIPLGFNPVLQHAEKPSTPFIKNSTKGAIPAIKLPFIEDFSGQGLFPNQKLWSDNNVFINRSLSVRPPSIGVATFDAMNDTGGVYPFMSTFPTVADTLTSRSIRLDSLFSTNTTLSPADSVYFSFFIQPQGMGDAPQLEDSIVLQFYNQKDDIWISVWNMEGMPLDTLKKKYGTDFLLVLIPITDSVYFGPNFKFRFYNYASITSTQIPSWRSGVYDHWNLDYIVLDANRTFNDTYIDDVAISVGPTTLLKNYQSMPWNQFLANSGAEMDYSKKINFKRLDHVGTDINIAQYFGIQNLDDKTFFHPTPNPSSINMSTVDSAFKPAYSNYTFNSNASPYADFEVKYSILHLPDAIRTNDTMSFYQRFYNYYAYDDGVPEAGYGLSTANGKLAIQFQANTADSIQAVQFYFNQTLGWANQQYFDIYIWNDNNGVPGNVIYNQQGLRPEFESQLFKYQTYTLDQAVAVNGVFYVGWKQSTKDNLNVGWDKNNDKSDKVFYNVTGNWYNSSFKGCTMIRPILGTEDEAFVGIAKTLQTEELNLIIAPNPVHSNQLHLIFDTNKQDNTCYQLRIFNISGQLVLQTEFDNNIDISHLKSGIYLLNMISTDGKQQINKKFIINK